MKKIIILTSVSEISDKLKGDIAMLIEHANDSKVASTYRNLIPLQNLIGPNLEDTRNIACNLASKLLLNEPFFRGIQQLAIFHEPICTELFRNLLLVNLHNFLLKEGYKKCEFINSCWWSDELTKLVKLTESSLQITVLNHQRTSRIKRSLSRLLSSGFNLNAIFSEFYNIINYFDPFCRRTLIFRKFQKNINERNKTWFYSTAVTYTNIALFYEPHFPQPFSYLVANKLTGGKPLSNIKRNFSNIFRFAKLNFIPKKSEIEKAHQEILSHISNISLEMTESLARDLFINSAWLTTFFEKMLANGLFSSSLFENWIKTVSPSLIVVGNQVYEGYALRKAKDYRIPTILLQHGVMSDYFKYTDYPADYFIVRGQFFYERLCSASQERAMILNPIAKKIENKSFNKQNIVFVTMPHYLLPIDIEMESILLRLLQTLNGLDAKLIIRVHPLEKISYYKNIITKLSKYTSLKQEIHYSQGDDINTLLVNSFAAIMFQSTVFLDCIKHNIPIIGFNWHNFSFKNLMQDFGFFYCAENLSHFQQLLLKAYKNELKTSNINSNLVLANTPPEEMKLKLSSITL